MAPYIYRSIQDDKHAFRVLTLCKGFFAEDIRCELMQARLPQNDHERMYDLIEYSALSYTWGVTTRTREIQMNGHPMCVTENLFAALRHLRSQHENQHLWVDAICIDQDNPKERSHQVGNMRHIYEEAQRVYVWLGDGNTQTDAAMNEMIRIEEMKRRSPDNWLASAKLQMKDKLPFVNAGYQAEALDNLLASQIRQGLHDLLDRPWFRRIWVIQEIACSRAARIICGKKNVSAQVFAQFPLLVDHKPDAHCQAVLDIMPGPLRTTSWWSEKRDLRTLLMKFRKSQATQWRDMVYALLGISDDAYGNAFKVDYRFQTSINEIVRYTVCYLLSLGSHDTSIYNFLDWNMDVFLEKVDYLEGAVADEALEKRELEFMNNIIETHGEWIVETTSNPIKLHDWAVEVGHKQTLKRLRSHNGGAIPSNNVYQYLLNAIRGGIGDYVILRADPDFIDVDRQDRWSRTLLSYAAEHGCVSVARTLTAPHLRHDRGSIDCRDIYGRTPLSYAAGNGHDKLVNLLVSRGASLNSTDNEGLTPLLHALIQQHPEVLQGFQTPLDVVRDYSNRLQLRTRRAGLALSLLTFVSTWGLEMPAKILHPKNFLVKRKGEIAGALLSYVVVANGPSAELLAERLIAQGANINKADRHGRTPLSHAASAQDKGMLALLVTSGARIEQGDGQGRTPLSHAAGSGRVWNSIYLHSQGAADPNTKDHAQRTPLSHASGNGHLEVMSLLDQEMRIPPDTADSNGRTPLIHATLGGHKEAVMFLTLDPSRIDAMDNFGRTALSYAPTDEIYDLLEERGADPDLRDNIAISARQHFAELGVSKYTPRQLRMSPGDRNASVRNGQFESLIRRTYRFKRSFMFDPEAVPIDFHTRTRYFRPQKNLATCPPS